MTIQSEQPQAPQPYQLERLRVIMRAEPHDPDEEMGVLNPATARGLDGKLYLFPRVVAAANYSRIGIAEVIFDHHGEPSDVRRMGYVLEPTESWEQNRLTAGCEDPRVMFIEPLGYYLMTYTAYGPLGPRIALAMSRDVRTWERIGPVKFRYVPDYRTDFDLFHNKDAYIFPKPVRDPHGAWALALIHRPSNTQDHLLVVPRAISEPRASIWISYCDIEAAQKDPNALLIWRDHQLLATPLYDWESLKIGGGTPPVLTPHGWLMLYHGVSGRIVEDLDLQPFVHYAAGAMILDRDDPRKILYRSATPILQPMHVEERQGTVPNVVFPTGVDVRENGRIDVYYGMADAAIGVAKLVM